MKVFVLIMAVLLAGCATKLAESPSASLAAPKAAPKVVQAPPLPAPEATLKRQSIRAFSVPGSSLQSDTTATNYGTVSKFVVIDEHGKKSTGVRIQWKNWPMNVPYSIWKCTDLTNWTSCVVSQGDAGATLEVIDQEHHEFYRIGRSFFGGGL